MSEGDRPKTGPLWRMMLAKVTPLNFFLLAARHFPSTFDDRMNCQRQEEDADGLVSDRVLPLSMHQRTLAAYRARVIPAAEGRVLEIGIDSGLSRPAIATMRRPLPTRVS